MGTSWKLLKCGCRNNKVGKDPDEVWSNLYREKEKNNMYRWVTAGELVKILETQGDEGILTFAEEKLTQFFYEDGPKEITFDDYCKWKRQLVLELGLEEDDSRRFEGRFVKHKALWKLNKRGVDGENLIHLLMSSEEKKCHQIARILTKAYPGLVGDVYLNNDNFGQSTLHLAVINNDTAMAELLLKNGADVNARACGDFFMPTDAKKGVKLTNYEGYAYYGEYPLAFAACFEYKDMYDLLMDYGADPNLKDTFGNTILHICVITQSRAMYSYAVQHLKQEADPNLTNNNGFTPLTLAARLGRKQIFDEMLELSKVEFWRFYNMACSAYPMTAVDTVQDDGSFNYESAVMTVINGKTESHLDMIGSEVIQRLMVDKWDAFAKMALFKRMFMLILHCIFVSGAAGLRPTELDRLYFNKIYAVGYENMTEEERSVLGPRVDDWFRLACEVLSYFLSILHFWQQYQEVRAQGFISFVWNMATTPARFLYSISTTLILFCLPLRLLHWYEAEEILIVLIVPATYSYWLFFCRTFKLTGPFVQMIYSMIVGDLFKFSLISSIFLIPFAISFTFLGQNIQEKQKIKEMLSTVGWEGDATEKFGCKIEGYTIFTYQDTFETLVSLFRASLGGYDYEELACTNYELFTKLLFVTYMLCMPVVMINILIAMMGNTYTTVIERAEKAWRQQYAQIVLNLERSLDKNVLQAHMLNYSIRLNDNSDARGLLVVKRTKSSKKQERKQALRNWKYLYAEVRRIIKEHGEEMAKAYSHGTLWDMLVELEKRPGTRARWPQVWLAEDFEGKELSNEGKREHRIELVPSYGFLQPPKIDVMPVVDRKEEESSSKKNVDVLQLDVEEISVHRPHAHLVKPGHVTFHEHFQIQNLPNMPTSAPLASKVPKRIE